MAAAVKRYRVSLANGDRAALVEVPVIPPFSKMLTRTIQKTVPLPDGGSKVEFVEETREHHYDVESEMVAEAIRRFNANSGKSYAFRELSIEPVGLSGAERLPVIEAQVEEAPVVIPESESPAPRRRGGRFSAPPPDDPVKVEE